jgi:hypothetical protein
VTAGIYVISLLIYRYLVDAPEHGAADRPAFNLSRYIGLLTKSHVWLLAPTWIAVNAALGLFTGQTLFQLVNNPDAEAQQKFGDQMLVGQLGPLGVTAGLLVAGLVFVAGLVYWGNRFKDMRRTTNIAYGIGGGALFVVAALALNHSENWAVWLRIPPIIGLAAGLFVLAGATPAALGLLADMSEMYPEDRGAIMGLYSVFLGLGQIVGALVGGEAARVGALDGVFATSIVFMGVALIPLAALRKYEDRFVAPGMTPGTEGAA